MHSFSVFLFFIVVVLQIATVVALLHHTVVALLLLEGSFEVQVFMCSISTCLLNCGYCTSVDADLLPLGDHDRAPPFAARVLLFAALAHLFEDRVHARRHARLHARQRVLHHARQQDAPAVPVRLPLRKSELLTIYVCICAHTYVQYSTYSAVAVDLCKLFNKNN